MFGFGIPWKLAAIAGVLAALALAFWAWRADIESAIRAEIDAEASKEVLDTLHDKREVEKEIENESPDSLRDLLGIPR